MIITNLPCFKLVFPSIKVKILRFDRWQFWFLCDIEGIAINLTSDIWLREDDHGVPYKCPSFYQRWAEYKQRQEYITGAAEMEPFMQKYSQILGTSRSSITTVILYVNCVTLCFHSNTFALFHLHKYHCRDTLQHFIISNRISPKWQIPLNCIFL